MAFESSGNTLDEKGVGCSAGVAAISTVPWLTSTVYFARSEHETADDESLFWTIRYSIHTYHFIGILGENTA